MTTTATTARERMLLAKAAARTVGLLGDAEKRDALLAIADAIDAAAADDRRGERATTSSAAAPPGCPPPCRTGCASTSRASHALAAAVREIAELPDPVGRVLDERTLPNGVALTKVSVPFGVVGSIYEARPNVTVDIAALALRSGNAVVLRGGSAAESTNAALVRAMRGALAARGVDPEAIQTVDEFGREGARELMHARGIVDVLVPRGSAQLIETVVTESSVPVIETGAGVVHIVLDESAPLEWARDIVVNAKVQRPSVCNSVETVLVHRAAADRLVPPVVSALNERGVTVHGDPDVVRLGTDVVPRPRRTGPPSTSASTSRCAWSTTSTRRSSTSAATRRTTPSRSSRQDAANDRAIPRRSRLRRRHGERLHPLHRRRRVRLRCRGRHLDAEAARPRADGAGRADQHEVARARVPDKSGPDRIN